MEMPMIRTLLKPDEELKGNMTMLVIKDKKISDSLEAVAGAVTLKCGVRPAIAFLKSIKVLNYDTLNL